MGLLLLLFACSLFAVHNLGGSKCAKKPLEMCKKKIRQITRGIGIQIGKFNYY